MDSLAPLLTLCALLCIVGAVLYTWHLRRIMSALEHMLETALMNDFSETQYDETRLSKLEARFARFLSASLLSRRSIDADRAHIKSLISDISHQTKTPLANISLYTQLLAEQKLPHEALEMAQLAGEQSDKLTFLIDSLVKLSRLDSGAVQVRPQKNAIMPLLNAIYAEYAPLAAEKQITFQMEETQMNACFDLKWTREAIGNLVDNAMKYTPMGGSVVIRAYAYELFCRIEVADSGAGVPEAERSRVFGRFYRGEAVQALPGVGLGLHLARQIAALGGGYLKVSDAQEGGASFSLYLPREM